MVCAALDLPDDPDRWLAGQSASLDAAYQDVVGRLPVNSAVTVDDDGRVHVERLHAIEEPASLIALRRELASMLPKVDLPEVILEVMSWEPRFLEAFTAVSGGQSRLDGLHTTIAACLTVHALNIGFEPIVKPGVEALERDRISHVNQTYLNADTYTAANRWLVRGRRPEPHHQARPYRPPSAPPPDLEPRHSLRHLQHRPRPTPRPQHMTATWPPTAASVT